ncbi:NlpC/P60 family protein, partial [Cellulomonas triticagri]
GAPGGTFPGGAARPGRGTRGSGTGAARPPSGADRARDLPRGRR